MTINEDALLKFKTTTNLTLLIVAKHNICGLLINMFYYPAWMLTILIYKWHQYRVLLVSVLTGGYYVDPDPLISQIHLPQWTCPAEIGRHYSCNGIDHPKSKRRRVSSSLEDMSFDAMVDSGTNVHITNDNKAFISYNEFPNERYVSCASGTHSVAKGVGTVCIALDAVPTRSSAPKAEPAPKTMYLLLHNVLYIPSMSRNYIDTTQVRKANASSMHIVGDRNALWM